MVRLFAVAAVLAITASAPAAASSYAATPITPAAPGRLNLADISWQCGPAACQGSSEDSRPLVLCQGLASRTGRLTAFLVDGRAFGPTELAQCNAKARGSAPLARAN